MILEDLRGATDRPTKWAPPVAARTEHLQLVLDSLPRPLPDPTERTPLASGMALLDVLRRCGHHDEAIRYGTALFNARPSIDPAVEVARNLAVTRHADLATQWLRMATRFTEDRDRLLFLVDHCPEFRALRHHGDLDAVLAAHEPPATEPNSTERET